MNRIQQRLSLLLYGHNTAQTIQLIVVNICSKVYRRRRGCLSQNVALFKIDFKIDEVEHPDELVDENPLKKIEDA